MLLVVNQVTQLQNHFAEMTGVLDYNSQKVDITIMVASELSAGAGQLQSTLERFITIPEKPIQRDASEKRQYPRINNSVRIRGEFAGQTIEEVT